MTGVLAGSIVAFTFMTTQAMLGSQRTLYESGDLALLFSAPIEGRTVLLAKLLGIAGTIALTYALLLLPVAVPVALLGHPGLFGIVALLAALALIAASTGLAVTLALASLAGPRAARTVGQIVAALTGGALFLASQIFSHSDRRESSLALLFERLHAAGVGQHGLDRPARPRRFWRSGRDPGPARHRNRPVRWQPGATLRRMFLTGYQDGGMRLSRARPTGRAMARLFHAGLFRSIFAKEWRLLARDPALIFQIVLRLIYLAPLVFVAFGRGHSVPIAPSLAFASVLIAGQLVGSFAWLTISAEDAPDLLTVAPVAKMEASVAKLLAAFAMAAPMAVILPIAIALRSPTGALVTLLFTAAGGGLAGLVELKLGKPGQRNSFARRRSGSMVAGLLSIFITMLFGGGAALAVYFLD